MEPFGTFGCLLLLLCAIEDTNADDEMQNRDMLFKTDPIVIINHFLTRDEQRNSRLINTHFNHYHNKANADTILHIHRLSYIATEMIINGTIKNETITELKAIYQKVKYTEYFLKKWPAIVGKCFYQKIEQQQVDDEWIKNFIIFMDALKMRVCNDSSGILGDSLMGIPALLVIESHLVFDALFFGKPKLSDLHIFLYETMWIYMEVRNSSFKLPPIDSIYYLDVNADKWQQQIPNLNRLQVEHGLIVWDPAMTQPKWKPDHFYQHVNEYMIFRSSCNQFIASEFDTEFMSYLHVRFVLKLLENNEYDFGLDDGQLQNRLYYDFEFIVHKAVHYLWLKKYWHALDQVLLALHDNNGLILLLQNNQFLSKLSTDLNVSESFVGILVELYQYNTSLEYNVCNDIAKSIYLWFIDDCKQKAMNLMANLHNRSFMQHKVLDILVAFLEEPIFHFIANDSKLDYLNALPRRKATIAEKFEGL